MLVVDDEPDLRESLAEYLQAKVLKSKVFSAASGAEGLQVLRDHQRKDRIDLILTDYRMPGLNGLQFIEQAAALAPNVPAILITAFPEMHLALEAFQQQRVTHVLMKPYQPPELLAIVNAILEKTFTPEQRAEAFRRSVEASRKGTPR